MKPVIIIAIAVVLLIPANIASAQSWPGWFSQVEQWASKDLISQQEFDNALEYLIEQGILQFEQKESLKEEKTFRIEIPTEK